MANRTEVSPETTTPRTSHSVAAVAECADKKHCNAEITVTDETKIRGTTLGVPDTTTSTITYSVKVDGNKVTAITLSNKGETVIHHPDRNQVQSGDNKLLKGETINPRLAAQIVKAAQALQQDGISAEEAAGAGALVQRFGKKVPQRAVGD